MPEIIDLGRSCRHLDLLAKELSSDTNILPLVKEIRKKL